ncbi:hypothetical protein LIER_34460 [Lithospermum erythrorhizon]|uniref:Uncharacterized protein n=1 Tax=Lithospermum erythrorhizon TaxID=34254 RepID=A0AAV3S394_LITER
MNDLLPYQDSDPNKDYIPIQVMYYVTYERNLTILDQYQFSAFSSICGSPVFDMSEGLTKNNEHLESSKKKKKI